MGQEIQGVTKAQKNGKGCAFATPGSDRYDFVRGLSKREYFAARFMGPLMLAAVELNHEIGLLSSIAEEAVDAADALLAELARERT